MGRGTSEAAGTAGSALLYGTAIRPSSRGRKVLARATRGLPSGDFEHPNFKPGERRLGTDHFYENRPRGIGGWSGTNQWAARRATIPERWRRKQSKSLPDDIYLRLLIGLTAGEGGEIPWATGREDDVEPIAPVILGAAKKVERSISWHSELTFPEHPGLDGCRVDSDHAMAVYKLAGNHGYWQLERRPGASVKDMVLTLRDEESREIIGVVALYRANQ